MREMLELMSAAFVACVVLVGMHAYLGMHVIQRKVIFVDLALAQIAALGATLGFLAGLSPHSAAAYTFSLLFAIAGAGIFALTRMRNERIPQEAIIGIVYAVALASAILVADRAPEGAEHIKETLVGSILWVGWPTVINTALVYALIGVIHFILRKRLFQISFDLPRAYAEKRWVRLWDFVFYLTFAFVITWSVSIAGVLLVFSFLVIPAVIAVLFAERVGVRLAIGWGVGIAACFVGLVASYRFDMPSGPTVVASLGGSLILSGLVHYVWSAEAKGHAVLKMGAGVVVTFGVIVGIGVFFTSGRFLHIEHEHEWEMDPAAVNGNGDWVAIANECGEDPACVVAGVKHDDGWRETLAERLGSPKAEETIDLLASVSDAEVLDVVAGAASGEQDPLIRLREARLLAAAGDRRGYRLAIAMLGPETPPLVRDEAHRILVDLSGEDYGYDPFTPEESAGAIEEWRAWAGSPE